MYKTIAEATNHTAIVEHVDDGYEPIFEIKSQVSHSQRSYLTFKVAKGDHANSSPPGMPSAWKQSFIYGAGGPNPMQGIGNDPEMEFSFNFYGSFNSTVEFGKLFVRLSNLPGATSDATLNYWSIVDRRWGEVFEIQYPVTNIILPPGSFNMTYAIPYDLIPHESDIESNLTFDSDMISRFNPTVSNGATLTIDNGVQIDMYNSELEIAATSTLVIDDNATIIAKDGTCKITVDGSISIGTGVSFIAEEGAQLLLQLNNTGLTLSITNGTWDGASILSYAGNLTISNSDFTDSEVFGFNGNYIISNCDFDNSFINISDAASNLNSVTISNDCNFIGSGMYAAIKIDDYPNFTIDNCRFTNNLYGIDVNNSGYGKYGGKITNCNISSSGFTGIHLYNTEAAVKHNIVKDGLYGIRIYNHSNVKLRGDNIEVTQEIKDNSKYEVYAPEGCFPYYFHWNAIVDNHNTVPLVYCSGSGESELNVINNYWGTAFSAFTDLYPTLSYSYTPIWSPGEKSVNVVESMYESAEEMIINDNYSGAKTELTNLLHSFPNQHMHKPQ